MKKYFLILACFGLLSCEQIEKIDKQMDADSTDIANEVSDMGGTLQAIGKLTEESRSELIFVARGSEPGWVAEYYTDKFRLLVDYGKDSLIIKNISKYFDLKGGYSFSYKNNEGETRLNVKIEDKACVDDATAEKKSKTVTITYNDKVYKGCGEEVEK